VAHIEHVAIWCRDLETMREFYVSQFGAVAGPLYRNCARGFQSYFLSFSAGARLELMSLEQPLANAVPAPATGLAHFALALGTEAEVDAMTARLRAAGSPVVDGPRRTGDGYYESVVLDPEGNRVELMGC